MAVLRQTILNVSGGGGGDGGGGGLLGGGGGKGEGSHVHYQEDSTMNPQAGPSRGTGPVGAAQSLAPSLPQISSPFSIGHVAGNIIVTPPSAAQEQLATGVVVSGSMASDVPQDAYSESSSYCNQLIRRGRGFPLYVPEPEETLPDEYQAQGVNIGDVGTVTPEGTFDFLFNIYLRADNPINDNDVPGNFRSFTPYAFKDLTIATYAAETHVSTPSIQKLDPQSTESEPPVGSFTFDCHGPQGAVLAIPLGSQLKKLKNLENLHTHIRENAQHWYQYANGPRGRRIANGSLYLITGCEKSQAWGIAAFQDNPKANDFSLSFRSVTGTTRPKYKWVRAGPAHTKTSGYVPLPADFANQTLFIHGFSISLGAGIWGKLFENVGISQIVDSRLGRHNNDWVPHGSGSQGSFSWALGFFGGGSASGGRQHIDQGSDPVDDDRVTISEFAQTRELFHPSQVINTYLVNKFPNAAVVLSHDDDWRDILRCDDDLPMLERDAVELLQRACDEFTVIQDDGLITIGHETAPQRSENYESSFPLFRTSDFTVPAVEPNNIRRSHLGGVSQSTSDIRSLIPDRMRSGHAADDFQHSHTINQYIYGGVGGEGGSGGGVGGGHGGTGEGPTFNYHFEAQNFTVNNHGSAIPRRAVSLEALYDSAESYPQPRCHPETRKQLLDDLYYRAIDPHSGYQIQWLHGPAGAGKSAVMQTLCRRLEDAGKLGGSFFFKRDHPSRGHAKMLFATLAYQLAMHCDDLKGPISTTVDADPSVVEQGMDVQLRELIVRPCQSLPSTPGVVLVIDGLDECEVHAVQREILHLIASIPSLRIVISSRPEPQIREAFEDESFRGLLHSISIEPSFEDVRIYLRDEFSRIHRADSAMRNISAPWPSQDTLEALVENSAGHFIFAVTVIEFVDDRYLHPSTQLDIIRNLLPIRPESLAAALEALRGQTADIVEEESD